MEERRRRRRQRTEEIEEQVSEEVEFDFEADLEIDRELLDEEFLQHPRRFMKWAELSAEAEREAKLAEETLKTVRSELVLKVNADPEGCLGEKKPTSGLVEAYYRTQPVYIAAKQRMIEAQHKAQVLAAAVSAFHARKGSLERLVVLQTQEYYSTPQIPRDTPEAQERIEAIRQKSIRRKVVKKLNQ